MKKFLVLCFLLATVSAIAQNGVKATVVTTNKTIKEVTSVTVDSASLDGFIKRYIDRNSATSTHTLAEIDAGVTKALLANGSGVTITTGNITASGLYGLLGANSQPSTRQLYYKDLLLNGSVIGKYITTETP